MTADPTRRRIVCAMLAVATIAIGLTWRLVPLGMSAPVVKYGGSLLWAAMLYWVAGVLLPRTSSNRIGTVAGVIALAVECLKLIHTPELDAFRETLAGRLLLGRVFSGWDLVAYLVAIEIVSRVDRNLRQH